MTDRSAFAEVLYNALKEKGFKYPGKIHFTDEEFDSYKDLSPKEMAEKYIEKHNLVEKRALHIILKEIFRLNGEEKFSFNMRKKMEELNLNFKNYFFVFRYANLCLQMKGEKLGTKYMWMKKEAPLMSDAEEIYEEQEKMRKYRFDYKEMKYVDGHMDLEAEQIIENLKKKKDIYELGALWLITNLKVRKKSAEKLKEKKAQQKVVFEKEIARKPGQQMADEKVRQLVEQSEGLTREEKREIIKLNALQNEPSEMSEGMLFIYMQKAEMFHKLAMDIENFNKRLEVKINQLCEELSLVRKENEMLKALSMPKA